MRVSAAYSCAMDPVYRWNKSRGVSPARIFEMRRESLTIGGASQPMMKHVYDVALLFRREWHPRLDVVPLRQAATTTGCGGMLRGENRMTVPRGLPAVVRGLRGR